MTIKDVTNVCMTCNDNRPIGKVNYTRIKHDNLPVQAGTRNVVGWIERFININDLINGEHSANFWERLAWDDIDVAVEALYAELVKGKVVGNTRGWCVTPRIIKEFENFLNDLRTCSRTALFYGSLITIAFVGTTLGALAIGAIGSIFAMAILANTVGVFFLSVNQLYENLCWNRCLTTFYYNIVPWLEYCKLDSIADNDGNPIHNRP